MDDLDKIIITDEVKVKLREEQTRLVTILEAYAKLEGSKEWDSLKELVFKKSLEAIERQMMNEAVAIEIKPEKLYRLQGEWAWAKQYSDVGRFTDNVKRQLEEIKKRLK